MKLDQPNSRPEDSFLLLDFLWRYKDPPTQKIGKDEFDTDFMYCIKSLVVLYDKKYKDTFDELTKGLIRTD